MAAFFARLSAAQLQAIDYSTDIETWVVTFPRVRRISTPPSSPTSSESPQTPTSSTSGTFSPQATSSPISARSSAYLDISEGVEQEEEEVSTRCSISSTWDISPETADHFDRKCFGQLYIYGVDTPYSPDKSSCSDQSPDYSPVANSGK